MAGIFHEWERGCFEGREEDGEIKHIVFDVGDGETMHAKYPNKLDGIDGFIL